MTQVISDASMPEYVANILSFYRMASPEQLIQGRAWYPTARDLAEIVGHGNARMGAGIIAALSPNTAWYLNVRQANMVANGEQFGTLPGNLANVARILSGDDPAQVLPFGKKTWHFFHNIIGEHAHVTIDRWAIRIALGTDKKSVTPLQYKILANAYRMAAESAGETAADMQAITWCVARGNGN